MTSKTKLLCSRLKFKNFFRYRLEGNYFCVRRQSNINSFIYYKLFVNQGFRKSIFQQKLLSACKTYIVIKFLYVGEQTQGIFPIGVVSNSKIHLKTCFKMLAAKSSKKSIFQKKPRKQIQSCCIYYYIEYLLIELLLGPFSDTNVLALSVLVAEGEALVPSRFNANTGSHKSPLSDRKLCNKCFRHSL